MRKLLFVTFVSLAIAALALQAQNAPGPQTPTADPYANNPNPGAAQFPLAAPAGKDSGARQTAPPGAVNQGPFDPATWKYGTGSTSLCLAASHLARADA